MYLAASAVVWFAQGLIFSRMLGFSAWQTLLLAAVYLSLFAAAVYMLSVVTQPGKASLSGLAEWRQLAMAPMIVAVVGSFISLPILLLILAAGRIF